MADKSNNDKNEQEISFTDDEENRTEPQKTTLESPSVSQTNGRRHKPPSNETNVLSANDRRLKRILQNQNEENYGTMSLGDKQEVILLIRGMVERVVMEAGTIYKLGRFEIGAAADNEIDMTPYGAQDRGVSRIHAEMQIIEGVVHIADLKSTNGTFVNANQLEPNTPTPLRKGDDLLLGRLGVQVLFR